MSRRPPRGTSPAMSDWDIAMAVLHITRRLEAVLGDESFSWVRKVARVRASRVICEACGCLCWEDESCPGCRATTR